MFVHCVNKFLHFLTENQQVLQLHKIESMSEWSVRKSHNRPRSEAARIVVLRRKKTLVQRDSSHQKPRDPTLI